MGQYVFSTVLFVDCEEQFGAALSNWKENGLPEGKAQLIVVDPWGSEEIRSVCAQYDAVAYLPAENEEIAAAYQKGLDCAAGEYINFSLASAQYSPGTYAQAADAFDTYPAPMVSACPYFINEAGVPKAYGGSSKPPKKAGVVSLEKNPHKLQLLLQAYFFRREILEQRVFHPELHYDALYQFLLEIQLEHPEYVYLPTAQYQYTVALEDNHSTNPLQYQLWWYGPSLTEFMIPLMRSAQERCGKVPTFLQIACYYLIYSKINCNFNDRTKGVLKDKEEVFAFLRTMFQAMTLIDNTVILERGITSYTSANRAIRMFLLRGKADALGKDVHMIDTNQYYVALLESREGKPDTDYQNHIAILTRNNQELFRIRVMNYDNGVLHIDANVGMVDFLRPEEYQIYAVYSSGPGKEPVILQPEYLQVYPLAKCFGVTFQRKCPVRFHIPVSDDPKQKIQFFYKFNGKDYLFRITFDIYNSRMVPSSQYSYWIFREGWMATWSKHTTLVLRKASGFYHLRRELLFCRDLFKSTGDKKVRNRGLLLRLLYWLMKPFYLKKHVWVTFDKQYKAGDNGEYMYQYLRKHQQDVEIYYIIREEAPDYPRMVEADKKHILVYGSLRCQLISLLAEVLLATHANIAAQYNATPAFNPFTKDLQRGQVVCIQHGLTIQKIAQYQNRVFDNTRLYCCASPYEVKNLSHPIYGYDSQELRLVGMARYDGLVNRDQKIILITPSWRRNVVNSSMANTRRTHNDNFKNSTYFRIYNQLINDETLIQCAKKNGYRIVYLLHPAMSAQIDDFDRNDYVELVPATGDVSYEKILCESSLMVTDYSGVQFDFAYMRKPVLYYHPDDLPPHYDEGGLIYSTMGFGPICTGHQQLVEAICAAMEQNCSMEEKYIRRADDFFAFDDHKNCERIYHEVKEWMEHLR